MLDDLFQCIALRSQYALARGASQIFPWAYTGIHIYIFPSSIMVKKKKAVKRKTAKKKATKKKKR